jgi:hypothetical protein
MQEKWIHINVVLADRPYRIKIKTDEEVALYDYIKDTVVSSAMGVNLNNRFNLGDEITIGESRFKIILNSNFNEDFYKDKYLYFGHSETFPNRISHMSKSGHVRNGC